MSQILRIAVIMMFLTGPTAAADVRPYIVVDVGTGAILAARDPFHRWYPASLTKLMTAYVALKAIRDGEQTLKSPVIMTRNASSQPPSKMGYRPGSVMTLENAIRMMMVKSANDVSVAVAEAIAGDERAFVGRMNAAALELGMTATRYDNPNGLHSKNNYTNARDQAVLTAALRQEFPEYAGFFSLEALSLGKQTIRTYNTMLGRFDGADGMKTGFVCESGFNLIATATRSGRTIAAVVLGADSSVDRAEKAADLLAAGFETNPEGRPVLSIMKPYGDTATLPDMRPVICSKEARSGRVTERDEDGNIVFRTPNLHKLDRAPVAVAVGLGGAEGISSTFIEYADVPIPTPRPDREQDLSLSSIAAPDFRPDEADSGDSGADGAANGISLPPPVMALPPFGAAVSQ